MNDTLVFLILSGIAIPDSKEIVIQYPFITEFDTVATSITYSVTHTP